jgi:hypothetical protein
MIPMAAGGVHPMDVARASTRGSVARTGHILPVSTRQAPAMRAAHSMDTVGTHIVTLPVPAATTTAAMSNTAAGTVFATVAGLTVKAL